MAGHIYRALAGALCILLTVSVNGQNPSDTGANRVPAQQQYDILCNRTVDMFFAIDASDSLFGDDFLLEKAFVKEVVEGLYLNNVDGIVVGIVVFSTRIYVKNDFDLNDKLSIFRDIDALTKDSEGTNTFLAIEEVRNQLLTNGRPNVEKAGIIITDGRSKDSERTIREATLTKNQNITLAAVGVGAQIDESELKGIASHDGLVYTTPDFETLRNLVINITGVLCPELLPPTTTTTTTTTPKPTTTTTTTTPKPTTTTTTTTTPKPTTTTTTTTTPKPTTTTTTTTTPYPTTTTTPPPTTTVAAVPTTSPKYISPCENNCRFIESVGYVPDEIDCTHFYQCHLVGGGSIKTTRKPCPVGLFWGQRALTCVRPGSVECLSDKCIDNAYGFYLHEDNCNAYWVCNGARTKEMRCCPAGMSFSLVTRECEVSTCYDLCPLEADKQFDYVPLCDKYSLASNPNIYLQQPQGFPYPLQRHCPAGLGFNNYTCVCDLKIQTPVVIPKCTPEVYLPLDNDFRDHSGKNTYIEYQGTSIVKGADAPYNTVGGGAAIFNGKSFISIPSYSNAYFGRSLKITFRYLPIKVYNDDTRREALISNSACDTPATVAIAFDRFEDGTYCAIETEGKGNQGNLLPVTQTTDTWREVSYRYDGKTLRLEVDSDVDIASAFGAITSTNAALRIGAQCDQFQGFTGYIDEVRVWKCLS